MENERFVGTRVIGARIGRSDWTVRRLAAEGHLPSYRTCPGGNRMFLLSEVDAWLAAYGSGPEVDGRAEVGS